MPVWPPWKTLISSQLRVNVEKQGLSSAYMALATVRPDGTPANRTVVFRGFAGEDYKESTGWDSDLLVITTDKRSNKMKELAANPSVELCWFMGGTEEQFRIQGEAHFLTDDQEPDHIASQHVVSTHRNVELSHCSLATRAFVARSPKDGSFSWQAERLRQWYRMSDMLRATFAFRMPGNTPRVESLPIEGMDMDGWCHNGDPHLQDLLTYGYAQFAVLIVRVTFVDHVVLSTGKRTLFTKQDDGWQTRVLN